MRTTRDSGSFKRDYRKVLANPRHRDVPEMMIDLLALLSSDAVLPEKYGDHPLTGDLKGTRDCHLKPDLVVIYSKQGTDKVVMLRIGSHSELGL